MSVPLSHWHLDPEMTFLNHGSFGACPREVLDQQTALRARLETQPVRFFLRDLDGLRRAARARIADFIDASPDDLAAVTNATTGVNTVLRSLSFGPGDELLVTDHEYAACRNALDFVAQRSGATVVVVKLPFPVSDPQQITDAILAGITPRTRLALIDHVTSQTGLVLPIADIVAGLQGRGIDVLVDGAHAPGMVDLSLRTLQPAYYTANLHKWCCAPKGAAFLYVRPDRQAGLHPLNISHGYPAGGFDGEFMWTGTHDPTPWLCVPAALDAIAALHPDGWPGVRAHNRQLALAGRQIILASLDLPVPCPDSMIGSMASFWLPDARQPLPDGVLPLDPTQTWLWDHARIEVPIVPWPAWPKRLMRVSAQLYNTLGDYERLADALLRCPAY